MHQFKVFSAQRYVYVWYVVPYLLFIRNVYGMPFNTFFGVSGGESTQISPNGSPSKKVDKTLPFSPLVKYLTYYHPILDSTTPTVDNSANFVQMKKLYVSIENGKPNITESLNTTPSNRFIRCVQTMKGPSASDRFAVVHFNGDFNMWKNNDWINFVITCCTKGITYNSRHYKLLAMSSSGLKRCVMLS